ncbi:MAG: helix-turn-helix domain-containing protein [Patescibacteria group bacterium]
MARFKDREKAVQLRMQGKTYSEIRPILDVSKSTLSNWLTNIRVSKTQLQDIEKSAKLKRSENYFRTIRERKARLEKEYFEAEKSTLGKITKRDLFIAGLFLYLGEGTKSTASKICISNSDPAVIAFASFWLKKILGVEKKKMRVAIHLYSNMEIEREKLFWSKVTDLPIAQFHTPYIKRSRANRITHISHGHGTCNIIYGNVHLKQRIMAGIKVILGDGLDGRVAQW